MGRADIAAFSHGIAPAGVVNGLAQTLLKLTAPGVPDIYQGTEFWDLSLVDPDNRRPVNFDSRMKVAAATAEIADLVRAWRDGRVKQAVIRRAGGAPNQAQAVFGRRLHSAGDRRPAADHVLAFARACEHARIMYGPGSPFCEYIPHDSRRRGTQTRSMARTGAGGRGYHPRAEIRPQRPLPHGA
jgi:(1->4)-alpha-D-glucan 1-alpha-D-glucosylmutase